jgi:glutamate dehydrogenase (NAD(P)+)
MIPKKMHEFLRHVFTKETMRDRLIKEARRRFLEFSAVDVELLHRIGIKADSLGPHLVVCMWDEECDAEIGGYLVVDNLAMGKPSMGGMRLAPDITPNVIHNLARGMTLKNAAAGLHYGGGKAGIVALRDLSADEHEEVIKGFASLIFKYVDIYNPGPDVGTNDADMKTVAIQNGLDNTLSKPQEMGGTCIDVFGGAAGGVVTGLTTVIEQIDNLKTIPQFKNLEIDRDLGVTVLIQGFGAVGANAARIMCESKLPYDVRITGISDQDGCLFKEDGLPTKELFELWEKHKVVVRPFVRDKKLYESAESGITYSNDCNNLLRESAFCFVPAAPVFNYLDISRETSPSITIDDMGKWCVVIEGANTYSPAPNMKSRRAKMERVVYRDKGVLIVQDYLVNSGGVIVAAQERLIDTPERLQIPDEALGNREKVEEWLQKHKKQLLNLSRKRAEAGVKMRDEIIKRNVIEFVELLASDANMLPSEAAEKLSVARITSSERRRSLREIMMPIKTVSKDTTIHNVARALVESESDILAVVSEEGRLEGVVTDWDITRASAQNIPHDTPSADIMSKDVVTIDPDDLILDAVRGLQLHGISAMPVVEGETVVGVISSDVLARRTLMNLLRSEM